MKIKTRKFKDRTLIRYLREAANFYLNQLLPSDKLSKLQIDIIGYDSMDSDGSCERVSASKYLIELKKGMSLELALITLAHEMVHVKQYVQKELKIIYVKDDVVDVWMGKRYRNIAYYEQPWEKEAFSTDENLYYDFLSECYATGKLQFN